MQFNSIDGPGKLVPDFKTASRIVFEGKEHAIAPGAIKNLETSKDKLEEKLEKKISDMDTVFGLLDLDVILDKDALYVENFRNGDKKLKDIVDKWGELIARHDDNGERTTELLEELRKCDEDLHAHIADIENLKDAKKQNDEFLNKKENKDWEEQFKKAAACITESYADWDDFKLKNPDIVANLPADTVKIDRDHRDFEFDLKQVLLDCANCPNRNSDPFEVVGKENWIKIFAATRMINDKRTPKKFILIGGQTYAFEDAKEPKIFDKESIKKARESWKDVVIDQLQSVFQRKKIKDETGRPFEKKKGNLRYLAFEIARSIIEDKNNLDIVLNEGVHSTLLDDEKKKIDDAVLEIFKENNNKEANRLVVRTCVYNEIGRAIAKDAQFAGVPAEERALKQRMCVDDVLQSFDTDLQEKITAFIDKREQPGFEGVVLPKEVVTEILNSAKSFINNNSAILSVDDPLKSTDAAVVAGKSSEEVKKRESKIEKERIIDQITVLLDDFQDKIKKISGDEEDKELEKFIKNAGQNLQELRGAAVFSKKFKAKGEDLKKRIEDKTIELAGIAETKKEAVVHGLLALNHDLLDEFNKIKENLPLKERGEFDVFIADVGDSLQDLDGTEFDETFKRESENIKKKIEDKLLEISKIIAGGETVSEAVVQAPVERKKLAGKYGEQSLEELKKNVDIARRKYDEVYAEKAESYREVISGLKNKKLKFDVHMAKDGDIAFYLEDYQQLLEQFLTASIENTDTKNDMMIEQIKLRTPKPNWFTKQLYKFLDVLNEGTPRFSKESQDKKAIELLKPEKKISEAPSATVVPENTDAAVEAVPAEEVPVGSETVSSLENVGSSVSEAVSSESEVDEAQMSETVEAESIDYPGGIDKLKKDLLSVMLMIVEDEKNIVHAVLAGESSGKLRDMKVKDLLEGKHADDFKRIPKDGRLIIADISRIKKLNVTDRDLTLRSFIMETLAYQKAFNKSV